jgi:hypothetical protein
MMTSWRLVVWGKRVYPRLRRHYASNVEPPANDWDQHEVSDSNADGGGFPFNGILGQTNSSKAADRAVLATPAETSTGVATSPYASANHQTVNHLKSTLDVSSEWRPAT